LAEPVASTTVVFCSHDLVRRIQDHAFGGWSFANEAELDQLQRVEIAAECLMIVDAVSIEYDARPADRHGNQQRPAGRQDSCQLTDRPQVAVGIHRLSVATQSDVL